MIALSTGSLYTYGTARVFEMAARAGYDGVEVLADHRWDTRQPAYLCRLAAEYEQPIVAIHSPFVVNVPGWPDDQLGRLWQTVDLAQALGVSTVVTHLPFRLRALAGHWHGHHSHRFFLPVPLPRRDPYADFLGDGLGLFEVATGVTIAVEAVLGAEDQRLPVQQPGRSGCVPALDAGHDTLGYVGSRSAGRL